MKGTEIFKKTISSHLQSLADQDPLFAETLKKPNKNIDECVTYILNTVKSSGQNGFADEEIFGMAVHYYDEDDIKPGSAVSGRVVVNHHVDAPEKVELPSAVSTLDKKEIKKKPTKQKVPTEQPSLFNF